MRRSWIVTLVRDDNGDTVLPLPNDLITELQWEIGDEIDFINTSPSGFVVTNLSMKKFSKSQIRRRWNSLFRQLTSDHNSLKRVLIVSKVGEVQAVLQRHSLHVEEIYRKAESVFCNKSVALEWMNTICVALGNKKPVDMLNNFEGRKRVTELLEYIESGEFS